MGIERGLAEALIESFRPGTAPHLAQVVLNWLNVKFGLYQPDPLIGCLVALNYAFTLQA
jgi:hypothetical protein